MTKTRFSFVPKPQKPRNLTNNHFSGDYSDGGVYLYGKDGEPPENSDIFLAINAALAARRPLLVGGHSGSGKSSLARWVAAQMNWRFIHTVITGRVQTQDLLWHFDAVQRLADAQAKIDVSPKEKYVEPGPLWWAIDPESARRRGLSKDEFEKLQSNGEKKQIEKAIAPYDSYPEIDPVSQFSTNDQDPAVLLIDEIDKADVDLPNGLLVPLGSYFFSAPFSKRTISLKKESSPPLIILTDNRERILPDAFRRRCIMLHLNSPDRERLSLIGQAHYGSGYKDLCDKIAEAIFKKSRSHSGTILREGSEDNERKVSTAEYLDTVKACIETGIQAGDEWFDRLLNIIAFKVDTK